MKISKVILIVVALHVLVIGGIFVFEGCSRSRLPASELAEGETPLGAAPAPVASVPPPPDMSGLTPVGPSAGVITPVAPPAPPATTMPAAPAPAASITHVVKSGDSLWKIARQHQVTVAALKKANNLTSDILKVGQKLTIPSASAPTMTASAESTATAAAATQSAEGISYTVAAGDSLWKIANRNGITVDAIKKANNLTSDSLKVGQKLIVPVRAAATTTASSASPMAPAGGTPNVSASIAPWSPSAVYREPGTYQENSQTIHVVDHNESPATIARKYGVRVEELMRVNGITDPRQIHYGQSLIIPATRSAAAAPVSTVAPALGGGN